MAKKNHNAGYVPINRRFFEHPFWSEEREYSKAEAWLDLVQAARFEDSRATELIRGRLVFWSKGQLRASVRFLAERWKWSKSKTDRFLELLETQQMITRAQMNGETIITLTNYEIYNQKGQIMGQPKGHEKQPPQGISEDGRDSKRDTEWDSGGTVAGQWRDETNKDNKGNKENNDLGAEAPPPKKTFKEFSETEFYDEVKTFLPGFPKEMLRAFFDHWSEKSASGKMKFQLEKTWETKKRLTRWKENQARFTPKNLKNGSGAHQQNNGKPIPQTLGDGGFGSL